MTDLKKTPFYEIHLAQGAVFKDDSGWLMPMSFGDELKEYTAVRNNVGIIDLSHRGKIILSGKEHIKFLQGILTNDVNKLTHGKGLYSTFLTAKGKIISDMRLYHRSQSTLLDIEPGLNERISELLIKNKISYKATIEDWTDKISLMSVQGPQSRKLIEKTLGEKIIDLDEYDFIMREINGAEAMIAKSSRTGEEGFDIYIPADGLDRALWDALVDNGAEFKIIPVGNNALETLRIEAGIPRYGIDMNENTIPIEAGLWHALSFDKGCYVGQEVIARIKWRGHVNRHLVGFDVEGDIIPKREDKVFNGEREIGYTTSSTYSPNLKRVIALGYIRREFKDSGTKVTIHQVDKTNIFAKVVGLPFLKRS